MTQSLFVCKISLLCFFLHCLFRLGSTICPSVLLWNSRKGQRTSNLITRSYSRFKMNHLFYFPTSIPSTYCGSPIVRHAKFYLEDELYEYCVVVFNIQCSFHKTKWILAFAFFTLLKQHSWGPQITSWGPQMTYSDWEPFLKIIWKVSPLST